MKRCSKCGKNKDSSKFSKCKRNKDGLQNQCKECRKAYKKAYRQTYQGKETHRKDVKNWRLKNPLKRKAENKISNAIKTGKLIKPEVCEICGCSEKLEAHHWSYLEEHWLDVVWCCKQCHSDIHNDKLK